MSGSSSEKRVTWIVSGVPAGPDNPAHSDGTCAYLSIGDDSHLDGYPSPWAYTGDLWLTRPRYSWSMEDVSAERDWLAQALQDQEAAYATLEQQYLALMDAHGALVDQAAQPRTMHECQHGTICVESLQ